jgi:predicted Zn-dependent protease
MDFFTILSEQEIRKAYENGEFDNLPGYGKPMVLEDLSGVPEELRMAYKLLKNAGFSPEENKIKQEMMTIEGLIKECKDPEEKMKLQKNLNEKLLRFNQTMSKRGGKTNSSIFKNYQQKMDKKFF